MEIFNYIIQDEVGIHARPASKLVQELTKFKSKVIIKSKDKTANAKSIINLMSLGIKHKDEVIFELEGEDEKQLLEELPEILNKFKI